MPSTLSPFDATPCIPADLHPRPADDKTAFGHLAWWRGLFPKPPLHPSTQPSEFPTAPDKYLGIPYSDLPHVL